MSGRLGPCPLRRACTTGLPEAGGEESQEEKDCSGGGDAAVGRSAVASDAGGRVGHGTTNFPIERAGAGGECDRHR